MNVSYTVSDLESAINYWRLRAPSSGEECALCPQAAALAEPYAMLIMQHGREVAVEELSPAARLALETWTAAQG